MLSACRALQEQAGYSLAALHVHHGLSEHADDWAQFCLDIARRLGVDCTVTRVAVERHSRDGLEGAARRARHAVFERQDCDWVVLAHHRDDQAETLLFNLLRGCGLAGASGMQSCNGKLLRPWLSVSRSMILEYARQNCLAWVDDDSNADTRFSRNFLRQRVFPLLEFRFSGGAHNLARASRHFAEAGELLDQLAELDLEGAPADFPLSLDRLRQLSEPRARNLLRYVLQRQQISIPSEDRLREAVRQLREAGCDRHPRIRFGRITLARRKSSVVVLE